MESTRPWNFQSINVDAGFNTCYLRRTHALVLGFSCSREDHTLASCRSIHSTFCTICCVQVINTHWIRHILTWRGCHAPSPNQQLGASAKEHAGLLPGYGNSNALISYRKCLLMYLSVITDRNPSKFARRKRSEHDNKNCPFGQSRKQSLPTAKLVLQSEIDGEGR